MFNGPLRQYFSLYRVVSQREGEREEQLKTREKCPNNPTRTYSSTVGLLLSKLVGRPGIESYPVDTSPPPPPHTQRRRSYYEVIVNFARQTFAWCKILISILIGYKMRYDTQFNAFLKNVFWRRRRRQHILDRNIL